MKDRLKSDKLFSPIITMIFFILIISIFSFIFEKVNLEGNITSIVNGKLESSIVVSKSILSKDGIVYLLSNLTNNFNLVEQLVLIIISLFSISILDSSGILNHLFTPFKRVKSKFITFFVVFLGVISSMILDNSYIILIPFVSVMYKYLNKNPILGIITVFVGITLGYGTGIIFNYDNYSMGILTELAAIIDVDPTYKYSLVSSLYIMISSAIFVSFLVTFLIEKYVSKKISIYEKSEIELKTSKKGLILSLVSGLVILLIIVIGILPNGILLDNTQSEYIAKLFSNNAPFSLSYMYLYLLICAVMGFVYGMVSKNFDNNYDYSLGFTKEFNNVGYLFILLFLYSILISVLNFTNIPTIFISKLMYLLELFDFTGIPLIVISFALIFIMSLIMPNNLEKWTLISPTLIPIFMRANITPDFTQFLFTIASNVGKCLSPIFIYFIITLGFIQKNNKDNKISLFNTFKYTLPVIITMIIFWLVLLVIWYISGLPLGIGTYATM